MEKKLSIKEFESLDEKSRKNCVVIKGISGSNSVSIDKNLAESDTYPTRTATFIITTSTPDSDADVILPDGINLVHYLKNPVVLWQHDRNQLPVGKCIDIQRFNKGWKATVEFAPAEANPMAEYTYQLVKGGFLSAVSIGFLPTDLEPNEHGGYTIKSCFLFEFSLVTVPANPEALVLSVKEPNSDINIDLSTDVNSNMKKDITSGTYDEDETTSYKSENSNIISDENNSEEMNIKFRKRKIKCLLELINKNSPTTNNISLNI